MKKIAILSTFQDFNPGYSLTGIVSDQIRMLKKHGHEVHLFVCAVFNDKSFPFVSEAILHKSIPFAHLIDYDTRAKLTADHKDTIYETKKMLIKELADIDIVFTHDFVFTGWNLPYYEGVRTASPFLPKIRWMHWIHSIPARGSDWWNINEMGVNHRLIYPNATDKLLVSEQYRGQMKHVRSIHHIKDLRTWFDFKESTCEFIDKYPAVMQAEMIQIYPAGVDRLLAKRVREIILMFASLKRHGASVCLVIASQWATGKKQKEDANEYKKIASIEGLLVDEEFIFTHDFQSPKYDVGIPKEILRELFLCSNVFIFPTREETFGLILPEACLCGVMPVLNRSLDMMKEIGGGFGSYHSFGSNMVDHNVEDEKKYYSDLAMILLGRMKENESIMAKTFHRMNYNWDALYQKEYAPIFAESETWR